MYAFCSCTSRTHIYSFSIRMHPSQLRNQLNDHHQYGQLATDRSPVTESLATDGSPAIDRKMSLTAPHTTPQPSFLQHRQHSWLHRVKSSKDRLRSIRMSGDLEESGDPIQYTKCRISPRRPSRRLRSCLLPFHR